MKFLKNLKSEFAHQDFFRDGWLIGLLILITLGDIFLIFWSATHIPRINIDLPVRFTSLSNFDQLGKWYQLYEIAGIALIVTLVNVFIAILLHKKNRILSVLLCIATLMVVILAIAILLGFTVIKYGTN